MCLKFVSYIIFTAVCCNAWIFYHLRDERTLSLISSTKFPKAFNHEKERWRNRFSFESFSMMKELGDIRLHANCSNVILSRRQALLPMITIASSSAIYFSGESNANAIAEVDRSSGELFSPQSKMIGGGGSVAARGKNIPSRNRSSIVGEKKRFQSREGNVQDIYSTRFITYLARFLLTFDPAARAWWKETTSASFSTTPIDVSFASFAESVDVGLADYFIGPYGSYGSVQAAKAGLNATTTAASMGIQSTTDAKKRRKYQKQGILNLLALLQARYRSEAEKIQLAILFSLISDPNLQPTSQISALLGEADNASIHSIELLDVKNPNLWYGGYSVDELPKVTLSPPPALGNGYNRAKASPILRRTSRILRIKVVDGGKGYWGSPPTITVLPPLGCTVPSRPCQAIPILDREGRVESVVVLDPGFGYETKRDKKKGTEVLPIVKVSAPIQNFNAKNKDRETRIATAVVELEYEITAIEVTDGGNGYVLSPSPEIFVDIEPPLNEPEWILPGATRETVRSLARVSKKYDSNKNIVEMNKVKNIYPSLDEISDVIEDVLQFPTMLLPNSFRPLIITDSSLITDGSFLTNSSTLRSSKRVYDVPGLKDNQLVPTMARSSSFRAVDPIFGGIGFTPVIKKASSLSISEYTRLALSGAICTVLVRTMLNPLELIKTKIQLNNDKELIEFSASKMGQLHLPDKDIIIEEKNEHKEERFPKSNHESDGAEQPSEGIANNKSSLTEFGTLDVLSNLAQLRGFPALFQSADITFLASMVFGSLGFGATELFRRLFSSIFFSEGGDESQLILLFAAAVACFVTSFAAAPFETLRVRSMSLLVSKPWRDVMNDFLEEKRKKASAAVIMNGSLVDSGIATRSFKDYFPLWQGFIPVVSRELPFAVAKFLAFDIVAKLILKIINAQLGPGTVVQVGVGSTGLAVSAFAGAIAGVAGALVSQPADLILTLTSTSSVGSPANQEEKATSAANGKSSDSKGGNVDWMMIVKELTEKDGGISNLFVGFPARATFFFLVIGLQFFLYDYFKTLFSVGSEDLTLVLDVFYAVRQGL